MYLCENSGTHLQSRLIKIFVHLQHPQQRSRMGRCATHCLSPKLHLGRRVIGQGCDVCDTCVEMELNCILLECVGVALHTSESLHPCATTPICSMPYMAVLLRIFHTYLYAQPIDMRTSFYGPFAVCAYNIYVYAMRISICIAYLHDQQYYSFSSAEAVECSGEKTVLLTRGGSHLLLN